MAILQTVTLTNPTTGARCPLRLETDSREALACMLADSIVASALRWGVPVGTVGLSDVYTTGDMGAEVAV